jgi:hypothetical protein
MTATPAGTRLEHLSGIGATFYVALFAASRQLVAPFKCSNPTWLRKPKDGEPRIGQEMAEIVERFRENLQGMAGELMSSSNQRDLFRFSRGRSKIRVGDAAVEALNRESVDFVLTSPPYCTRIDYTAATRVELAILGELVGTSAEEPSHPDGATLATPF